MKLLLTILLIFTTLLLSAQTPDYFSDNPKWRQRSSCAIPYPCIEDQEFVYYLNGDSIVDNFTYKKVYKRGELTRYPLAEPPSPCFGSWTFDQFHTLLRQDEKRIYIRTIEEDLLLYDFELSVGDTLAMSEIQWNEGIVVTSIDSILVGDHYRKIFFLDSDENPRLIEGIGHEHGFIEPFLPIFECGNYLNCFSINDTSFFPIFNEECDFNVDIEENFIENPFSFFPNPTNDHITIQFRSYEQIEEVFVYNTMGQVELVKFQEIDENQIRVDLSHLKNGFYIIQLQGNKKTIYSFKVVKD